MARNLASIAPDQSTDANFRLWIQAIESILSAGGFVQTADTGQANFATISRPTVNNTVQGYQIWRSNDATGGLNNFYIKLEVGGGNGFTRPSVWLTVGWGSNGSGALTGNLSTRTQFYSANDPTLYDSPLWCDTGAFAFNLFSGGTGLTIFCLVERVRDTTGAKTDAVFFAGIATTGNITQVIPRSGSVPVSGIFTTGQCNIPASQANYGTDYGFSEISPIKGVLLMPSGNIFGADATNFVALHSLHSRTVYSESRTYILTGYSGQWATGFRILMRYDT